MNQDALPMNVSLSALKVLTYFDLFDYPLTREEIGLFLDQKTSPGELFGSLNQLAESDLAFRFQEFYCLRNDPALVERRNKGNQKAAALIPTAYRISAFLYNFPFVRGIGISGSLSKNFADENADIDYFIITKSNRLWIARTLMHLYKKLTYITGRQHCHCMNYYVDEEALTIQEKNIFTAIEVKTLIPVCGNGSLENFFNANTWTDHYYPNCIIETESRTRTSSSIFKKLMESLFNNAMGDQLDNYLMKLTSRRWKIKETRNRLNAAGRKMGLQTGKHFSKPNPQHLQKQILELFEMRFGEMREKIGSVELAVDVERTEN